MRIVIDTRQMRWKIKNYIKSLRKLKKIDLLYRFNNPDNYGWNRWFEQNGQGDCKKIFTIYFECSLFYILLSKINEIVIKESCFLSCQQEYKIGKEILDFVSSQKMPVNLQNETCRQIIDFFREKIQNIREQMFRALPFKEFQNLLDLNDLGKLIPFFIEKLITFKAFKKTTILLTLKHYDSLHDWQKDEVETIINKLPQNFLIIKN